MTDKMIYHCILALHNSQKREVARISGLSKCSWNDFRKLSERDFKELEREATELSENYKAIAEMLHQITGG